MSRSRVNVVDDVSPIQTWDRTPGKPNFSTSLEALSSTVAWGSKKNVIPNAASSGVAASKYAWPMLSNSSLPVKNGSSQWPAPANFAGRTLGDAINDFSIPNSWNAPGTSLALRALSDANNLNDPWPPLDTSQPSNHIEPVSASRSITDNGHLVFNENAFDLCPKIHSAAGDQDLSGRASAVDDQQLPSTSDDKTVKSFQQPANVSDSGDHIDSRSETSGHINTLVNSKECWGRRPVNQTTFWDVAILNEESASPSGTQASIGILGDSTSFAVKQRRSVRDINDFSVEFNVWSREPPTGTSIWEMHYEGLGDRSGLGKQPSLSSNAGVGINDGSGNSQGDVASPAGSHRLVPSFIISSSAQQPFQGLGGNGGFKNHIFPPQLQQRFSQATSKPTAGLGKGAMGSNNMLDANAAVGSGYKLQPSAGWSFSLTSDDQSPLGDNKRLLTSSGLWGSKSQVLGKQQQAMSDTNCWPSPLPLSSAPTDGIPSPIFAAPSPWQGGMDSRKFVPWPHHTAVASQPPLSALPQRFHLRQNTSVMPIAVSNSPASSSSSTQPMRLHSNVNQHHLTNPQHVPSFTTSLRTDIAKQLMVLGLHDDAVVFLSDNSIEDFEKFLYEIRERTNGMYPGLNQLIHSVSTFLVAAGSFGPAESQQQQLGPPPQTFDLFDDRGGSAAFHTNKSYFAGQLSPSPPSEALGQLLMRESHLQSTIIHLDKKKRELSMKHLKLRKISMDGPTAHHSNSMLQEIVMQQAQISRQIEVQEAQLGQVRLQIAFLARITTGGGSVANGDSAAAAAPTAMPRRLRSGGGGGGGGGSGASSNRMTNHPMGAFGSVGPRGNGMLLNSPAPADLAVRLADFKVSMDTGHQTSWEGGGGSSVGVWDVPSPQQFNHASSSNVVINNDSTSNVFPFASSTLGNRRRTAYNASSDFHQPPIPSPTSTAVAVANAIWNASWLLLSDLTPQFSLEALGMSIATALDHHHQQQQQQQNGAIGKSTYSACPTYEVHPNLLARYVLIRFLNHADASVVSAFISAASSTIKLANSIVMISPAEAVAKLQEIKA